MEEPDAPAAPLPYIEYGGRLNTPPSFPSTGGRFRGFVLTAERERLRSLCERLFDEPAAGAVEYRAIGSSVLLLVGAFAEVRSSARGFEHFGSTMEVQASMWFPVAAGSTRKGRFTADRIVMAVPYIWVDNAMSLTGGREIYGYPKSLGRFDPEDAVGERVRIATFGGNFGADSRAGWRPMIEIARGRRTSRSEQPSSAHPPAGADGATRPQPGRVRELALGAKAFDGLRRRRLRQLFLKQFRDVAVEGAACYQAVIEAPIRVTRSTWRPSLKAWHVAIHSLDSHPVAEELGVRSQITHRTYLLEMDMVAEPGIVVAERWSQAPVD